MRRRDLIQGIAATGALGVGVVQGTSQQRPGTTDVSSYDVLYVVEDGERVDTVETPTWETVREREAALGDQQRLVTPDGQCTAFCEINCPCFPCAYGCSNCCNPSENICSGCDDDS